MITKPETPSQPTDATAVPAGPLLPFETRTAQGATYCCPVNSVPMNLALNTSVFWHYFESTTATCWIRAIKPM